MSASVSSAALFDVEPDTTDTQSGWASYSVGTPTTDDGITMDITSGFAVADGRDRNTAATTQGADNNDNPVPAGPFSDIYRDFYFSRGDDVTVEFSGLVPDLGYIVTVWSYDSGATSGTGVIQDFLVDGNVVGNITYNGDLLGPGPDPDTTSLDDYSATFIVTADASGEATFVTGSSGTQGARINGVQIVPVPEPGAAAIAAVCGLIGFATRRRS